MNSSALTNEELQWKLQRAGLRLEGDESRQDLIEAWSHVLGFEPGVL